MKDDQDRGQDTEPRGPYCQGWERRASRHWAPAWDAASAGAHPWAWRRRRPHSAFLFLRFASVFGLLALSVLAGMAAVAYLLARLFGGNGVTAVATSLLGLALAVAFSLLAGITAVSAFRGIPRPLSDVMAAADAVAAGNLNVRVPVHGPGEFARLAISFNNMIEELSRADQRRRNLTADVAHELRTPLQIIQGNLEGVLDGVYEPTPEHIEATLDETRALARLVEDLRTLSLAEAGQLKLVRESVDVADLLADAATSFSGTAEAAGITLATDIEEAVRGIAITGDPGRLDQILSNLLANALRHTPGGGKITLGARALPGGVRIWVADTGEGIPVADLPYVFDRFWRGDRARTRTPGGGSGLGLAIAKQLVEAHGGRIGVASRPGEGATFTIDLPASA